MARQVLKPPKEGKPIGMYSAGMAAGPGSLVFVAGQVAMDADGRVVGAGDVGAQAEQVFRNLQAVLGEAGCGLKDVVKFTTFLVRNEDWGPFGEWRRREYGRLFPDGVYPPNTGMVVTALARPELLLEIEAIAVRPARRASARPTRPVARPASRPAPARRAAKSRSRARR